MHARVPASRISLVFEEHEALGLEDPLRDDLSAVECTGRCVWVASDETTSIERLTETSAGTFGEHRSYSLIKALALPDRRRDREIDIEGLCADGGRLWVVGSHSVRRRTPRPTKHDQAEMLERLAKPVDIERCRNRYVLAAIPLIDCGDGLFDLDLDAARRLPIPDRGKGSALTEVIDREHRQLRRYLKVPGKENGFDIEGLAVRGRSVYVGLRGPVLSGFATILKLRCDDKRDDRLELAAHGEGGERIAVYHLDLEGLGIRDLAFEPNGDLLVLAGPTMVADGPCQLFRWRDPERARDHVVHSRNGLKTLLRLGSGPWPKERPEGLARIAGANGDEQVVVVYDAPNGPRVFGQTAVYADVLTLS